MHIVTSARYFLDIDGYACAVAYAELLLKKGIPAQAVSTATWNASITPTVRSWQAPLVTNYTLPTNDHFVLVDISESSAFDRIVTVERVVEIIDHHPGYETLWQEKIGNKAKIDRVGAACTLVYEEWELARKRDEMSQTSARLLMCGILDNTLNFKASITTERDKHAYRALMPHANLGDDWPAQYFGECQAAIMSDVGAALKDDTKPMTFATLGYEVVVGQIVIWDARPILEQNLEIIEQTLASRGSAWFTNIVNIGEGRSYIVCKQPELQQWLSGLLGITFEGTVAVSSRLWLRKEMVQADLERMQ